MTDIFKQLLVAKLSPQNGCHAPDGEVLYVAPVEIKPRIPQRWHFLDSHLKKKSKFGWVQERDGFTIEEFLCELIDIHPQYALDSLFISYQISMLNAASKCAPGEVLGADFLPRGIPPETTLVVHKVLLHGYPK
jgi:hypothetical protein